MRDGLLDTVFEKMEVLFLKTEQVPVERVRDRGRNEDQRSVDVEQRGGLGFRVGIGLAFGPADQKPAQDDKECSGRSASHNGTPDGKERTHPDAGCSFGIDGVLSRTAARRPSASGLPFRLPLWLRRPIGFHPLRLRIPLCRTLASTLPRWSSGSRCDSSRPRKISRVRGPEDALRSLLKKDNHRKARHPGLITRADTPCNASDLSIRGSAMHSTRRASRAACGGTREPQLPCARASRWNR